MGSQDRGCWRGPSPFRPSVRQSWPRGVPSSAQSLAKRRRLGPPSAELALEPAQDEVLHRRWRSRGGSSGAEGQGFSILLTPWAPKQSSGGTYRTQGFLTSLPSGLGGAGPQARAACLEEEISGL